MIFSSQYRYFTVGLKALFSLGILLQYANATELEEWNAKFQTTYIWQQKQPFKASYSGLNSLLTSEEKSYSFTATIALGFRPWNDGELYFNPEVAQGVPLSKLTGLGGMSNGEMARTSGAKPTFYRARLFLRQSWGLGGEQDMLESSINQLAGKVDKRRLVMTAGNISVLDIFDLNSFNHDPRTQFINWSVMTHGAYDFAADSRGYTSGIALEYFYDEWALRAGRFIQPKESNGLALDSHIFSHYGDQIEIEHGHQIGELAGKIRVLAFRNVTAMGSYQDALSGAAVNGSIPAVSAVRKQQAKLGVGINIEQAMTENIAVFGRASWADGKTETYAFAEIDRSISAGLVIKGNDWKRVDDVAGIALAQNRLSTTHRDYLAAGGLGFFVGDGHINYHPERIYEIFYNIGFAKGTHFGFNFQHIDNPAYNRDRGPVSIGTLRFHSEF